MADDLHCKLCKLLILKRGSQHRRLVNSILPMTDAFIYDVLQTVYDYKVGLILFEIEIYQNTNCIYTTEHRVNVMKLIWYSYFA